MTTTRIAGGCCAASAASSASMSATDSALTGGEARVIQATASVTCVVHEVHVRSVRLARPRCHGPEALPPRQVGPSGGQRLGVWWAQGRCRRRPRAAGASRRHGRGATGLDARAPTARLRRARGRVLRDRHDDDHLRPDAGRGGVRERARRRTWGWTVRRCPRPTRSGRWARRSCCRSSGAGWTSSACGTMTLLIAAGFGLSLLLLGFAQGWLWLIPGFVGIRLLGQGSLGLAGRNAVTLHFRVGLGRAVAIAGSVAAVLQSIMPFVLAAAIASVGWRETWIAAGAQRLDRGHPRHAAAPAARRPGSARRRSRRHPRQERPVRGRAHGRSARGCSGWSRSPTPSGAVILTGFAFLQISVLGEAGLSASAAAAMFIPLTIASVGFLAIVAPLAGRWSTRVIVAGASLPLLIAMLLVPFLGQPLRAPGLRDGAGCRAGCGPGARRHPVPAPLRGARDRRHPRRGVHGRRVRVRGRAPWSWASSTT